MRTAAAQRPIATSHSGDRRPSTAPRRPGVTARRAVAARGEAHIADALAPVLARCVARRAAARRPLLQRTVQTAAQALWDEGHRTLEDWLLQAWLADQSGAGTTNAVHHGVNAGDLAAINNGLAAIANFHAGVRQMRSDTGRRGAFTRGQLLTWLGAGGHAAAFPGVTQQRLGEVNVLIAQIEQEEERDRRIAAAQRKLATAQAEAPGVGIDHHGISVNLDTDQLKHQPSEYPIGTRQTSGGTKYSRRCDRTPPGIRPRRCRSSANGPAAS
jgi:hypothetical protein